MSLPYRKSQDSYIPQELKDKKKKLQVDMAAIRDSVDDYIPDELKARKQKLQVNMAAIRDAAQDYVPENVRRIRYQYAGDARNKAQDYVPEEYKDIKRERIKEDGPSFLKHGTTKEIIAEDDGLLKSRPYSREELELQAQKAREMAKDVIPEDIKFMAMPTLRHRIVLKPELEIEGIKPDQIIGDIFAKVKIPR